MKKIILTSFSTVLLITLASTSFAGSRHWRRHYGRRGHHSRVYVSHVYYPRTYFYIAPNSSTTYASDVYVNPGPVYVPNINPIGPYVGINIGAGFVDDASLGADVSPGGESGFAYGIDVGANLSQNLAIEGGVMRLPNVVKSNNNGTDKTIAANNYYMDLALKASVLLSNSSSIFVKVGVANAGTELVKNNQNKAISHGVPLFVVGFQIQATPTLGLLVQYTGTTKAGDHFGSGVPAMSALSFGVVGNV
jgi:hypothetical protein